MKENALQELLSTNCADLYDAESRLVKALPKMAKAANSDQLRSGFEHHLEQTKQHVSRLKQILTSLDEKPAGKKCPGMVGIIQEADQLMEEDFEDNLLDPSPATAMDLMKGNM